MVKKILIIFITLLLVTGCSINNNIINTDLPTEEQILLADGIETDNLEEVIDAINNGVDINSFGKYNTVYFEENPLYASIGWYEKISFLLIQNGATLNYKAKRFNVGANCLMKAAANQNEELCKLLIEKGININETDKDGKNAIDYTIFDEDYGYKSYLQEKESLNLVKMLYKKGVKILDKTKENIVDDDGCGNTQYEIIKWLIDIDEIKETDLDKNQKIFYSVYLGNLEKIKRLNESQLNIRNSENEDLLVVAAKYGKTDIVKYLLEKGFDPKRDVFSHDEDSSFCYNAITYAATSKNIQTLKPITNSCNLSDKELYRIICRSIALSTTDEYVEGISYLADLMKNINEADGNENDNILSEACISDKYNIVKELINKKNINLNGNVLIDAVDSKNIKIVKLLIKHGINVNEKYDNEQESNFALDHAIMNGDYDIAKLLKENNAKSSDDMKQYILDVYGENSRMLECINNK